MKLGKLTLIAVAFTGLAAGPTLAQPVTTVQRTVTRTTEVRPGLAAPTYRKHRVCRTKWRNHRRVRTCYMTPY